MDAVGNRTVECGQTASYYYYGKDPAFCFDTAVPFGLNTRQMNAWMYQGDGLKLTREMFAPRHIVNFPFGNTGTQMGGWYRKEIKRSEEHTSELQSLMRISYAVFCLKKKKHTQTKQIV